MDALTIGLSPERFWALSLRELWNEHRAHIARSKTAYEHDVTVAWHVENFRRHDPKTALPNLRKIFREMRGEGQSSNEMVHALHTLSSQYGLKLTVKKASHGKHQPDRK